MWAKTTPRRYVQFPNNLISNNINDSSNSNRERYTFIKIIALNYRLLKGQSANY